MKILAIESSCDESAICLSSEIDNKFVIIDEIISTQVKLHAQYGGVVPELASREHLKNIPLIYNLILKNNNLTLSDIDLLAVTVGPGMLGCLLMGSSFVKGLSSGSDINIACVNHIEGHILAPLMDNPKLQFPYLSLVVSGGHTLIVQVNNIGEYKLLAKTTDDAAGEAYDKCSYLLGFPYPGGALLANEADTVNKSTYKNIQFMKDSDDFSFSGFKTAISLLVKKEKENFSNEEFKKRIPEIAFMIQSSINKNLITKLKKQSLITGIKTVTVTGGVSANKNLRMLASSEFENVYYPKFNHSVDNAAMIGFTAYKREKLNINFKNIEVNSRWKIYE